MDYVSVCNTKPSSLTTKTLSISNKEKIETNIAILCYQPPPLSNILFHTLLQKTKRKYWIIITGYRERKTIFSNGFNGLMVYVPTPIIFTIISYGCQNPSTIDENHRKMAVSSSDHKTSMFFYIFFNGFTQSMMRCHQHVSPKPHNNKEQKKCGVKHKHTKFIIVVKQ